MVDFLNLTLTKNFDSYFAAYCQHPPLDDSCSFGYCPNPDIAGPLVRAASYITNFCLSLMIFYSPADTETALWSQLLTMFSLLLTAWFTITQATISRPYAVLAAVIAGSPLSIYLFLYAVVSFWHRSHRLKHIFGDGQVIPRFLAVVAGGLWIALLTFSLLVPDGTHFAQRSCEGVQQYEILDTIYLAPFFFFEIIAVLSPELAAFIIFPIAATVLAWTLIVVIQRKNIWPQEEKWRPHLSRIWTITGKHYSFIHFMLLVLLPNLYWIAVIELACVLMHLGKGDLSFGQLLAAFVALPPLVSVARLWPKFAGWFRTLSWVRRLRRPWRVRKPRRVTNLSISSAVYPAADEKNLYSFAESPTRTYPTPHHNETTPGRLQMPEPIFDQALGRTSPPDYYFAGGFAPNVVRNV